MGRIFVRSWLAAAALASAGATHAAVLVNNAPNLGYGTNISFAMVADDFSLAADSLLSGFRFYALQQSATDYSGSVYWAIYDTASGAPGSLISSGTVSAAATATGVVSGFGYERYSFDVSFSLDLAAGTYWLALQDGALGDDKSAEILWEWSDTGGSDGQYQDFQVSPTPSWETASANHAFEILGDRKVPVDVPEPGTLALLAASVLALRLGRRTPGSR